MLDIWKFFSTKRIQNKQILGTKTATRNLIEEGFINNEISKIVCVSERTIYRYILEYALKIREFSKITDNARN